MKICIINSIFNPYSRGGAERVVENQAQNFLNQGHQLCIITVKPFLAQLKKTKFDNHSQVTIYRFFPLNIFSIHSIHKFPFILRLIWRFKDIFNIYSFFKVKKILAKEKPDIVYAHNLTGLGYLIPLAIRQNKLKYIQFIHDVALIRPNGLLIYGREKENFIIQIYFKLTRRLFKYADEVFFPSNWIKNYYLKHNFFPTSQHTIQPNFKIKIEDLLTHKKSTAHQSIRLLYVGQLEKHKGILFFIKVFNNLTISKNNALKLDIVGSGKLESIIQKYDKQNSAIQIHGRLNQTKLQSIYRQADYTIVPSLCYENSPTVIFESLQNKVPVIASRLGGIVELVQHGKNGYLFEPGNRQALLSVLEKLIDQHSQ